MPPNYRKASGLSTQMTYYHAYTSSTRISELNSSSFWLTQSCQCKIWTERIGQQMGIFWSLVFLFLNWWVLKGGVAVIKTEGQIERATGVSTGFSVDWTSGCDWEGWSWQPQSAQWIGHLEGGTRGKQKEGIQYGLYMLIKSHLVEIDSINSNQVSVHKLQFDLRI